MSTFVIYEYDCCGARYRCHTSITGHETLKTRAKLVNECGRATDLAHASEHPECPKQTETVIGESIAA